MVTISDTNKSEVGHLRGDGVILTVDIELHKLGILSTILEFFNYTKVFHNQWEGLWKMEKVEYAKSNRLIDS